MKAPLSRTDHMPTPRLREAASSAEGADWVHTVTHLFDLPDVAAGAGRSSHAPHAEDRHAEAAANDEPGAPSGNLPH